MHPLMQSGLSVPLNILGENNLRKKYKLVVSDIDGTITDERGVISPPDLDALHRVEESGVKFALCTGRAARGCSQVLGNIPSGGYHIFFDGALVCDSTFIQTIYSCPIEKELLKQVIELAYSKGLALELFSSTGYFVESDNPLAAIHRDLMQLEWSVTDFSYLCEQKSIIMGCLVIPTIEEKKYKPVLRKFEDNSGIRFSWSMHAAHPEIRMVNVIMKGVSKGSALTALCGYLGFKPNEVIAIGDGSNDVSLLEVAGLAIAMQNAPPELKAVADYVTADLAHNGFAQAMEKFLL